MCLRASFSQHSRDPEMICSYEVVPVSNVTKYIESSEPCIGAVYSASTFNWSDKVPPNKHRTKSISSATSLLCNLVGSDRGLWKGDSRKISSSRLPPKGFSTCQAKTPIWLAGRPFVGSHRQERLCVIAYGREALAAGHLRTIFGDLWARGHRRCQNTFRQDNCRSRTIARRSLNAPASSSQAKSC